MSYVIGVDLGTSAVKTLLVNEAGTVVAEAMRTYPLTHDLPGWSEQQPEHWVTATIEALKELTSCKGVLASEIQGISFSGQMHGLVLLDDKNQVIRPAILWNDTRTTEQCREIQQVLGDKLLEISRNQALEGFTLPKILWVAQHESELFEQADSFLLPKDYLRYRLTGQKHIDFSDAAGTLLLDIAQQSWSKPLLDAFKLPETFCPKLVQSHDCVGVLLSDIAEATGLSPETKVFAGGADNACGAIGAGILSEDSTLCSIGTSGVILSYEGDSTKSFGGKLHFFNHSKENAYYAMGVTLAAGYSLSWFKKTFADTLTYDDVTQLQLLLRLELFKVMQIRSLHQSKTQQEQKQLLF